MSIEPAIVIVIVACGVVAFVAKERGRSPLLWFVISFLLTPILGVILLFLAPTDQKALEEESLDRGDSKRCNKCDELIRRDALRCRFCGYDPGEARKLATAGTESPPLTGIVCKKCGQAVTAEPEMEGKFVKCAKCQAAVYVPYSPSAS